MIFNLDKRTYLAKSPRTMISFGERLRGMIGRNFSPEMDAAVFPDCNSIHMLFMGRPLDVVFLDGESRIVKLAPGVPPWRPVTGCRQAVTVIELPPGAIQSSASEVGDFVNLNMNLTPEAAKSIELCHESQF